MATGAKPLLAKLLGIAPDDLSTPARRWNALRTYEGTGPLRFAYVALPRVAATSVQDTGFDLPTKGIVTDAFLDVTTLEATGTTKTLDVGLLASESGGDEDGFMVGVSVATPAAVKIPVLTKGAETYGALLKYTITDNGSATHPQQRVHVLNGTAKSVTYTLASSNDAEYVAFAGILYLDLTN